MALFVPVTPFPLRSDHQMRAIPYVTYSIIALNVLIHLINASGLFTDYGILLIREAVAATWGFTVGTPQPITMLTHAFLHGDFFHLFGNMLLLYIVGKVLEDGIGYLQFTLFYFTSLVVSLMLFGLIIKVFAPGQADMPLIGASGAISGVMGLAAFRYYRLKIQTVPLFTLCCFPIPIPVKLWLPFWFYAGFFAFREVWDGIAEIVTGEQSNVAHWAHIGGLLIGAVIAIPLQSTHEGERDYALQDAAKASAGTVDTLPLKELQKLLKEKPDDPELQEAMGAVLVTANDLEPAFAYYTRAVSGYIAARIPNRAAMTYMKLCETFPGTLMPVKEHMAIASALESLHLCREAVQTFDMIIEHYADTEHAQAALLRVAHIYQTKLNEPDLARQALHTLLAQYPGTQWDTLAKARLKALGG